MDKPFELVPDSISRDTIEALQTLLDDAKTGDVIGVAYAVMYKRKDYIVNVAGEAYRSPTFARGMVQVLGDHLIDMIRAK